MMPVRRSSLTAAILSAVAAVALALSAASVQASEIAQRQAAMKRVGEAMKVLGDTIKGELAFDGQRIAAAGQSAADSLAATRDLFPAGSEGDSRARPEIWQDLAGFVGSLDRASAAARQVSAAGADGDEGAFRTAFVEFGGTCRACHEKFRKPQQ